MGKRHPNYRHVKIHRNYTAEEIAMQLGIHKNTVRNWLKNGLATCEMLIDKTKYDPWRLLELIERLGVQNAH